jgi:peptidoglycan/xylan/chitin deacetylase (PgdA/CDA1 family)
MIGRQASAHPELARRVRAAGHSIGTHSQNHPLTFDQMPRERAEAEINDGIASVAAALGEPRALAPFFRIPGLLRVGPVEDYLNARGIAVWSADFDAEDWYKTATPQDIVRKAISRLEHKGRGILLLHDVHPATALALPILLRELKARGFRVVQVVPRQEPGRSIVERQKPRPAVYENRRRPVATHGWQWSAR